MLKYFSDAVGRIGYHIPFKFHLPLIFASSGRKLEGQILNPMRQNKMKRERIREFCIEILSNLKLGEKIMDEN